MSTETVLVSLTAEELDYLLMLAKAAPKDYRTTELLVKLNPLTEVVGSYLNDVLFASYYQVSKVYGGPEEGGWYYTINELLESTVCVGLDDAVQFLLEVIDDPNVDGPLLTARYLSDYSAVYRYPDDSGFYVIETHPGTQQDARPRRYYE